MIYSDAFIKKAFALLNEGRYLVQGDEEMVKRVDRVRMQPLYLHCMRHREASKEDGTWKELKSLMQHYKARAREGLPTEKFIREF